MLLAASEKSNTLCFDDKLSIMCTNMKKLYILKILF